MTREDVLKAYDVRDGELAGVKGIYLYEGDQGFVSLEHIE